MKISKIQLNKLITSKEYKICQFKKTQHLTIQLKTQLPFKNWITQVQRYLFRKAHIEMTLTSIQNPFKNQNKLNSKHSILKPQVEYKTWITWNKLTKLSLRNLLLNKQQNLTIWFWKYKITKPKEMNKCKQDFKMMKIKLIMKLQTLIKLI